MKYIGNELSCKLLKSIFLYVEDNYGKDKLEEFLDSLDIDRKYLLDENNWITFSSYKVILHKLVRFSGKKSALFESGNYVASPKAIGVLYPIFKIMGNPGAAYKKVLKEFPLFNKVATVRIIESKGNRLVYEYLPKKEEFYEPDNYFCLHRTGQFAAVPTVWGLPKARIRELKCMAMGDPGCIYEISWVQLFPYKYSLLFTIIGGIISLILYLFGAVIPGVILYPGIPILTGLLGWIQDAYRQTAYTNQFNREQQMALEKAVNDLNEKIDELTDAKASLFKKVQDLTLLNTTSEIISQSLDLDKITNNILKIISKNLSPKRVALFLVSESGEEYFTDKFVESGGKIVAIQKPIIISRWRESSILDTLIKGKEEFIYRREKGSSLTRYDRWLIKIFDSGDFGIFPLKREDQVSGFLAIECGGEESFWDENADIIKNLCNQVAISIENAISYKTIEDLKNNLERKVEERTIELKSINLKLEESYQKLKSLDELKSDFVANISHELRTPLTLILAPLEKIMTEKGQGDREEFESLDIMHKNSFRLLKLINNLLDFSKIEAGKLTINPVPQDIVEFIGSLVRAVSGFTEKKGIIIYFDHPESLEVEFDSDQMEKVILNLLSNAIKFTPTGGEIRVSVEAKGKDVEIRISDTGAGIPKHQLAKIFDRFAQVEGKTKHMGTGIGLALASELVELHHGKLKAESIEGEGSTFTVTLPQKYIPAGDAVWERRKGFRRREDREIFAQKRMEAVLSSGLSPSAEPDSLLIQLSDLLEYSREKGVEKERARGEASKKEHSVVLAEDNSDIARVITLLLEREYEVHHAWNGLEALELVKKTIPDIIISDVMMPEMNGYELVRAIRGDEEIRHIPLLLLSAKDEMETKLAGLEHGADDYLPKPFNHKEFLLRVKNLINLRKMDAEIQKRNRELKELLQKLKETQAEIVHMAKMASLGTIAAGVAHEINNPVNYIYNSVEPLEEMMVEISRDLDKMGNERMKESLAMCNRLLANIKTGAGKTAAIVQDLRDFARFQKSELLEVDIREGIEETLRLLYNQIKYIADVHRDYGELGMVECFSRQLNQVFMNILQNAIHAIDATGRGRGNIWITTRKEGGEIYISIRDDGIGIKEEIKSKIFDPFFTTKPAGKGTGFGLSIAFKIIDQHGGRIEVNSEEGKGTEFIVIIPDKVPQEKKIEVFEEER